MGAQTSKTAGKAEVAVEKPAEGAAVAAKPNGQVNYSLMFSVLMVEAEFGLVLSDAWTQWRAPRSLEPHARRHSGKVATCNRIQPFNVLILSRLFYIAALLHFIQKCFILIRPRPFKFIFNVNFRTQLICRMYSLSLNCSLKF